MPDLKIGLLGATGRMGKALANEILAQSGLILSAAGGRPDNESVDRRIRPYHHKIQAVAVTKNTIVVFERSEVVLDFTEATAAVGHARLAAATNTPLLIGTTGLSKNDESEIAKHAQNIAILRSRNTSRGIALLTLAIEELSHGLGDDFVVKIHDIHHSDKKDAPSGTALMLAEAMGGAGERAVFSSSREGSVIGEHQILFTSADEEIRLIHRAKNRKLFATGALQAARWLKNQPPGLYSMKDVFRP